MQREIHAVNALFIIGAALCGILGLVSLVVA